MIASARWANKNAGNLISVVLLLMNGDFVLHRQIDWLSLKLTSFQLKLSLEMCQTSEHDVDTLCCFHLVAFHLRNARDSDKVRLRARIPSAHWAAMWMTLQSFCHWFGEEANNPLKFWNLLFISAIYRTFLCFVWLKIILFFCYDLKVKTYLIC